MKTFKGKMFDGETKQKGSTGIGYILDVFGGGMEV